MYKGPSLALPSSLQKVIKEVGIFWNMNRDTLIQSTPIFLACSEQRNFNSYKYFKEAEYLLRWSITHFHFQLCMVEAGKPQSFYRHVNPSATPQQPLVAWCCCNYSFCFCTLPAWLCILLNPRVTSGLPQNHCVSLSPTSCSKQGYHQHQSRATGSAAVPGTTRKFWHKTHNNIQTSALVTSPGTTWAFKVLPVVRNSLLWRKEWGMKVLSYTEVGIASPSLTTLCIFTNRKKKPDSKLWSGEKS